MWMISVSSLFHVSVDSKIILKIEMSHKKPNSHLLQPGTMSALSTPWSRSPTYEVQDPQTRRFSLFPVPSKRMFSFPSKPELDTAIAMSEFVQYNISFMAVRYDHKASSCWYILLENVAFLIPFYDLVHE